ncbi:MAG: response regulator transcription factor [Nocardioidaceae bacterium]|nr:response regulator transcription factor [Nocardioidaceae bacterium]
MPDEEIALLICDDHRILTDALAAVVASEPGLRLVADPVDNAEDAVSLTASLRPDVVLMDIELSGPLNGIEATRQITKLSPTTKVIVVSGHRRPTVMVEAVEAGAVGFLDKGTAVSKLLQGVRAVAAGEVLLDSTRLARLMPVLAAERKGTTDALDRLARLTSREQEILRMLAEGSHNDAIARRLSISVATARTHISNILTKMGVHSRLEAVALLDRRDSLAP